ncbi:MAG: hypothetical protein VX438_11465 [Planctomycetota bacterium]|nr:hypothetical protein [Planctomycetota bacterium]
MRFLKLILAIAVLVLGNANAQAQILPRAVGQWEARAGFRALERPATDQENSPIFLNAETGATLLDSHTLTDLNIGVGPDFSFSMLREDGLDYEIRFFFNTFNRNTTTRSDFIGNSFDDFTAPDAGPFPNEIFGDYTSDLVNIELNQKRIFNPYVRLLHGVRFLNIAEKLSFSSSGSVGGGLLLPPIAFSSLDVTETKNPMLGYQIGVESKITLIPGLDLDAYFKAGLYNNFASRESVSTTTAGFPGQGALFSDSNVISTSDNVMGFDRD